MKNYIQASLFQVIFVLVLASFVQAGINTEMALGSRSYSLGQVATISYSDILNSINNPSSLSKDDKYTFSLYYSEPLDDSRNASTGFSIPTDYYGTFGLSYYYFILDDISGRDIDQNKMSSISWSQKQYVISWANQIYDLISYGINAKWLLDSFSNDNISYIRTDHIGIDFSFSISPNINITGFKNLGIGFTLKNLIQVNDDHEYLPKEFRFIAEKSARFDSNSLFFIFNYSRYEIFKNNYHSNLHFGLEYGYKFLFIRVGHNNNLSHKNDHFSLGIGIKYNLFKLDYGFGNYLYYDDFDQPVHNITLSFEI